MKQSTKSLLQKLDFMRLVTVQITKELYSSKLERKINHLNGSWLKMVSTIGCGLALINGLASFLRLWVSISLILQSV